jgi:hypothetical protein
MDKIGLGLVEETEEELYALLDKAMEDERLCVSEELIQKTLKRVEESPASTGVHHKSKNYSRLIRWGSVAAAAVLVVFVGGRIFAGGFRMGKGSEECSPDAVNSLNGYGYMSEAEPSTERPAGETYFYRCPVCGFVYQVPDYWVGFAPDDEMEFPHIDLNTGSDCPNVKLVLQKDD